MVSFSNTHFRLLRSKRYFLRDFLSTASVAKFCYEQFNCLLRLKIRLFSFEVFLLCVCSFYLLRPFRKALSVHQDTDGARRSYVLVFVFITFLTRCTNLKTQHMMDTRVVESFIVIYIHTFSDTLCKDDIPVSLQKIRHNWPFLKLHCFIHALYLEKFVNHKNGTLLAAMGTTSSSLC